MNVIVSIVVVVGVVFVVVVVTVVRVVVSVRIYIYMPITDVYTGLKSSRRARVNIQTYMYIYRWKSRN